MVGLQISVKILSKVIASKEISFVSGQKPFASGLQVKKTHCKWFASGLQVVHKPFASGLLANKSLQTLSKLVCYQIIKNKWFRNALVNKHILSKAL